MARRPSHEFSKARVWLSEQKGSQVGHRRDLPGWTLAIAHTCSTASDRGAVPYSVETQVLGVTRNLKGCHGDRDRDKDCAEPNTQPPRLTQPLGVTDRILDKEIRGYGEDQCDRHPAQVVLERELSARKLHGDDE
jgi:hypothetical protein